MNAEKINHLIATEVMGWKDERVIVKDPTKMFASVEWKYITTIEGNIQWSLNKNKWNPLENIEQAMMIADKFDDFNIDKSLCDDGSHWFYLDIYEFNKVNGVVMETCYTHRSQSLCEAICLAALKAKGVEVE